MTAAKRDDLFDGAVVVEAPAHRLASRRAWGALYRLDAAAAGAPRR